MTSRGDGIVHPSIRAPNAATLVEWLDAARARLLSLVADLSDEQLRVPKLAIVNPFLWELGHVAWFQEKWNLRHLARRAPLRRDADELFDSAAIAHDTRWQLRVPRRESVLDLLERVLAQTKERLLERERANGSLASDERYFAQLALFHEQMHGEALAYTRQTLALPRPSFLVAPEEPRFRAGPWPGDVEAPGGAFTLGAQPSDHFVFDNEKWAHELVVAPFRIARAAVTQGEFAEFVDAGGYARRELWSDAGWKWRESERAEHPVYWRREPGGRWLRRRFDQWLPLAEHAAVCFVNWFEADAWCRWRGRRLPTEVEWEVAASGELETRGERDGRRLAQRRRLFPWGDATPTREHAPLDARFAETVDVAAFESGDSAFGCRQMFGNVWEWTASDFQPYPGFVVDPYAEYSEPWFDGRHKVLRGGCFVTSPWLIRNTWRNWYTPDRRDVFAGFRTCATT